MENKQVTFENVDHVIENFDRILRRARVAITLNTESDKESLITEDKQMQSKQYVIAVGNHVTDIKPGDLVEIDLNAITRQVRSQYDAEELIPVINIEPIEVGEYLVALIDERIITSIYK